MTTTHLITPFKFLEFASRGAGGHVFFISDRVAFKCCTRFTNPNQRQAEEMAESAERIAHEKGVYQLLMANPHPNILRCIYQVPEGFFMERMAGTLHDRINKKPPVRSRPSPPDELERRWILQLCSAAAWLETLGLAHGDLRPRNILLTTTDDVCLADFDCSVQVGEEVYTACEPFGKLGPGYQNPIAGPATEQFALGTCIYMVRFGEIPMAELESHERVQRLMRNELPPRPDDEVLGDLIMECWRGEYDSVAGVNRQVRAILHVTDEDTPVSVPDRRIDLAEECRQFLEKQQVC